MVHEVRPADGTRDRIAEQHRVAVAQCSLPPPPRDEAQPARVQVEAEIVVAVAAVAASVLVPHALHRPGHEADLGELAQGEIDAARQVGYRLERYPCDAAVVQRLHIAAMRPHRHGVGSSRPYRASSIVPCPHKHLHRAGNRPESRPVRAALPPRPSHRVAPFAMLGTNEEDDMTLSRRAFLQSIAGLAAAPASTLRTAAAQTTSRHVRIATGLLATWQSTAWLGAKADVFEQHGIEMSLPAIAVGGPQAAAAVIRGECEFAHTGAPPVAEEVLKGRDIVILATPTSEFPNSFVMARKEITQLAQLDGKKVGVLTDTGQTSVAARITIEKAGATAIYLPLIKFARIHAALAAGEIDAGALPIDMRFAGESRYGWNAFPIREFG